MTTHAYRFNISEKNLKSLKRILNPELVRALQIQFMKKKLLKQISINNNNSCCWVILFLLPSIRLSVAMTRWKKTPHCVSGELLFLLCVVRCVSHSISFDGQFRWLLVFLANNRQVRSRVYYYKAHGQRYRLSGS